MYTTTSSVLKKGTVHLEKSGHIKRKIAKTVNQKTLNQETSNQKTSNSKTVNQKTLNKKT